MTDIGHSFDMAKQAVLTEKRLIALTPETAKAIEDFRFAERIKTEAEAIRRLIDLGLDAAKAAKPQ